MKIKTFNKFLNLQLNYKSKKNSFQNFTFWRFFFQFKLEKKLFE